ncbi:MAG TPA: ribosome recycling factor [Sedimentisphaerales bacterium]|nr:ribosome recycling factor [Sedimentisphaerales bacterium]
MSVQSVVTEHQSKMSKTIEVLHNDLKGVRTGRASTGLVENILVEYYGNPTPLKQLANLAAPQGDLIVIKPFDVSILKEIEKTIKNSDLSIAPVVDGKLLRLNIPPLSQERRTQMSTQAKNMGEQAKIVIRNIRRDANKELDKGEKDKLITEDDRDHGKKQMDDLTKDFVKKIDDIIKAKSDEIMQN